MTKNILLVEYDETTINFIKELLPPPVFEVAVANDGETAKQLLAEKSFDLMITAAMLPRFHGFNLSLAVAKEYQLIRIIIISAVYKGSEYRHQAVSQYRADDFFEKPLEKDKFKKRVLELLNMSVDTTKIPVSATPEPEKSLSTQDIFGDIINHIEKVPQFEIDLNNGRVPKKAEANKEAARKPGPAESVPQKKAAEPKLADAATQKIDANLEKLKQQEKKEMSEKSMRKIEVDIAKKLEETLSGLGLGLQSKPVARPAPAQKPPMPVTESRPAPTEKPPMPVVEKTAVKAEKKPVPEENPNEVGDYVLLGLIARGGMAEIYKAKKKGVKGFEKVIAIKKILSGYGEDDKYIEMLVDEAKIAAELSHPNIVQIYDLGHQNNYYFIAMEYVPGKDLRLILARLRDKGDCFPEHISLYLISKILEALHYAHKAKDSRGRALEIVHRDVSPANIIIAYNGDVKLTDFGISKTASKMRQNQSGALNGKLLYMSPEQARGEDSIDFRSDLYSVGVLLFELLTGKKLFAGSSEMAVLKKVQNGEIINPRDVKADIDPVLEKIIMKALNKDCEKRYQSAAALIADLEAYMAKKYAYIPGAVHMSHFIFDLFEADIVRDGIKVELKPIPEKRLLREIPKAAPKPAKPLAADKDKLKEPAPPAKAGKPEVKMAEADELVHIDFAEDKAVAHEKKKPDKVKAAKKPEPVFREIAEEKKKRHFWPTAALVLLLAATAVSYFQFIKIPADRNKAEQAAIESAKTKQARLNEAAKAQAAQVERQKALEAERLKQEEELRKQQSEEARKKILEEKRLQQAESERLQNEAAERQKQEEAARLQKEAEDRAKQEEQARLQKEAEDKKKAEELRIIERNRVKEGDIVPIGEVDVKPSSVSTPDPIIPSNVKETMFDNQIVLLSILINHNGDVEVVRLLQKTNNSQLNTILTNWVVKTWKYRPASKGGVRVKVWKTVKLTIKK